MADRNYSMFYSRSCNSDISLEGRRRQKHRPYDTLTEGYREEAPMIGILNDFRSALKEDPAGGDGENMYTPETKKEWELKKKYMVRSGPTDEEQYRENAEKALLMHDVSALLKEKKVLQLENMQTNRSKCTVINVKEFRPPTPDSSRVIEMKENKPTPEGLETTAADDKHDDDDDDDDDDVNSFSNQDDSIETLNLESIITTFLPDEKPKMIQAWNDVTINDCEQTTSSVPCNTKSSKVTSISPLDLDLPLEPEKKKKGFLRRLRDTIVKKSRNARYRFNAVMTRLKKGPPYMIIYVRYCWVEPIP